MISSRFGVRGKLNIGLCSVLLVVTVAFGTGYAFLERGDVLEARRAHLRDMAGIARLHLGGVKDRSELELSVNEFTRQLSTATGRVEHVVIEDNRNMILASSQSGTIPPPPESALGENAATMLVPPLIWVTIPLSIETYVPARGEGHPARLVLHESAEGIVGTFRVSLLRHLGFAAGLVGVAMFAAAVLVQRIVLRPVRELVTATESVARDGFWGPIYPSERRRDEIGVLADRLAEMSRRLPEAVRSERYGSAHLMAVRVRRELGEPLRRSRMQLSILESLLSPGSDAARAREQIAAHLKTVRELVAELDDLGLGLPKTRTAL
jgi:HAMP domain-containing protein